MQKLNQKYISYVVKKALDEDLKPLGDVTTKLIKFSNKKIKAKIIAKQNGVIAGIDFCKQAFKIIGKETIFKSKIKDGKFIKKNKVIAEILANTGQVQTFSIVFHRLFLCVDPQGSSALLLSLSILSAYAAYCSRDTTRVKVVDSFGVVACRACWMNVCRFVGL